MGTQQAPEGLPDLQRVGKDALLTVELDPQRADRGFGLAPDVFVIPPGAGKGERFVPELTWTSPDTLEARFTLDQTGTYLTMLSGPEKSDDGRLLMTRGPAVTLPYSPEFAPREGQPLGGEVLMELAEMSGGVSRLDVVDILGDPPTSARTTSMLPWLCGAVIGILLLEIAGRRLSLWSQLADVTDTMIPQQVRPSHWAKRLSTRNSRKSQKQSSGKTPVGTTAPAAEPSTSNSPWIEIVDTPPKGSDSANQPPSPPIPPDAPAATDIFSAAKNRARRRMK
ncbi:MAG: hypothetical protein R3C01_13940 [Planctomycetaceae bacterium]